MRKYKLIDKICILHQLDVWSAETETATWREIERAIVALKRKPQTDNAVSSLKLPQMELSWNMKQVSTNPWTMDGHTHLHSYIHSTRTQTHTLAHKARPTGRVEAEKDSTLHLQFPLNIRNEKYIK